MFIGGGIKPGRVIGKTDGYKTLDNGWKFKEQPMMDHVVSTIYSSFGIDWSKKIVDNTLGTSVRIPANSSARRTGVYSCDAY